MTYGEFLESKIPQCLTLIGDALERLKELPDESVHCCVTSPPYFGLRDYGVKGQIGMEKTPAEYVAKLVAVFEEVRRVLRKDGTLWVNLGDSYNGSGKGGNPVDSPHQFQKSDRGSVSGTKARNGYHGFKQKDLIGIPWLVAFALRNAGWYLRSDIIWAKPNCMPESVTDRPTRSHEYIFLLSKSAKYFYDAEAIKEPCTESTMERCAQDLEKQTGSSRANGGAKTNGNMKAVMAFRPVRGVAASPGQRPNHNARDKQHGHSRRHNGFNDRWDQMSHEEQFTAMRNKRDVWTIPPANYPDAHFATFPPDLIKPCVLAGCPVGGVVLDPFAGSGTTGEVALELGRKAVLVELNPAYEPLIQKRTFITPGFPTLAADES